MGRRRISIILALLLAALLPAAWPGGPVHTLYAEDGWTEPFAVSDDEFGWFPDVAADAQGAVHVIWGSGAQNATADPSSPRATLDLLRYRVLRDGEWSPRNDIALTCYGGYTVRNSIVANRDGQVNVLVRTCFDVSIFSAPSDRAWAAGTWSQLQRLGAAYYNTIAADSKGTLHALYNESLIGTADGATLLSDIFYRRSTDGGQSWSVRTNIARLPGGDERMQIKVDGRDRVHAVWDHGSDWYLGRDSPEYGVYRRSDDGGQTWQEAKLLGVGDGPVVQTTLGLTGEGNPLAVYRSAFDTQLYFQRSPDGGDTWLAAQPLPLVLARDPIERGLDSYSMATDSAGNVHLLVSGFPAQSAAAIPMLLHLRWDGQAWSPPAIVSATMNRPLWPRLAVASGNQLHAVWFSYTEVNNWGERRVWHSTRAVAAPAGSPPPLISRPPPAAAFRPGSAPTADPKPGGASGAQMPAPTLPVRGSYGTTPPPSGLAGTQALLAPALALVPAFGLVGAVLLLVFWRRTRTRR